MIGNRARYDWPVDRGPTQGRYTSLGDVSRGVEISMELETTIPASEVGSFEIPLVGMSASGTLLATVPGVHNNNLFSQGLSFVLQELLQLEECPTIELSVELPASAFLNPYTLQVLQGKDGVGRIGNLLADAVVHILHKPFLSPTQAFQFTLGGSSAFLLKPIAEILISCPYILHLFGIEESIIGTDSDIHNAPVDAENFTFNWFRSFLLNSNMQKECAIGILQYAAFDLPVEIPFIVFRQSEGGFNSAVDGGNTCSLFDKAEIEAISVVADGTIKSKHWKLLEFHCSESFTSYIPCRTSKICWQSELLPHIIVSGIMDDAFTPSAVIISPLSTVVCGEIESFDSSEKLVFIFINHKKLEFDRPSHIHILALIPKNPFDSTVKVIGGEEGAFISILKGRVPCT